MSKMSPSDPTWVPESQLGLETYVDTIESEQARTSIMERVLGEIRQRLDVAPHEEGVPSIEDVRALFARYQRAAPTSKISQMVSTMRDE